jgi:hypothetical protein
MLLTEDVGPYKFESDPTNKPKFESMAKQFPQNKERNPI